MNTAVREFSSPAMLRTRLSALLRYAAFLIGLRLLLGGVFMHAGLMKIRDPAAFGSSLATYQLLPPALISLLAFQFPWLELILGFLLIAGFPRRAPALGIIVLSLLFAAAHGQAIARGIPVDCGCFGAGHSTNPSVGLILSSALVVSATWLYFTELSAKSRARGL